MLRLAAELQLSQWNVKLLLLMHITKYVFGKDKVIIYVPKDFHKDILKNFRGQQIKVTLEEAV
jgi:hypothetical protein